MTWRELTVEQFNDLHNKVVVDVRSPCEHIKENIPGSFNVPLLSDEERSIVGTIYAQQGEAIARRRAVDIIAPKIPSLIDRIASMRLPGHALVVHCWRGGLRSEAVVSFLSIVGLDSFRLAGGYKAWRRSVVNDFNNHSYAFRTIILDGLTGAGKTDVLKQLLKLGEPVLDLEHLANHRGSAFGGIGLAEQPSQKNFEGRLWQQLRELRADYLFVEAESRKIGHIAVPSFLLEKMKVGGKILVESTLDARCERLLREYTEKVEREKVLEALHSLEPLKERLGKEKMGELTEFFRVEKYHEFTEILLNEYYDPMYCKHLAVKEPFDLIVNANDPEKAAGEIHHWVSGKERFSAARHSSASRD